MSETTRPLAGPRSILAVIAISTFLLSAGTNMLNIAVPAITTQFCASATAATVLLMAYPLLNTMLIIPAGQIADVLDRRLIFLIGLALYTVLNIVLGFSPNMELLIVGRALQGMSSAILLSSAVSILMMVFPQRKLTSAMGIYMAGFSVGQVTGPMLGGAITTALGWQWLFWAMAPITLLALVWGLWAFRSVPTPARAPGPRRRLLDLPGAVVLAVMLGCAQLAVSLTGTLGLSSPIVLTLVVVAVGLVPVLLLVERRVPNPVLHPELFRRRDFPVVMGQGMLVMLPRVGVVTAAGLYLQGIYGDSAALAALKTLTFPILLTLGSLTAGRVSNLLSRRTATIASASLPAVGLAAMLVSVLVDNDVVAIVGLGFLGLGNGVFQTLNSSAILTSVPKERASVVNAIRTTALSFGNGIGLALSMALIVAFVSAADGAAFMAGNPSLLSADGRAGIDLGFVVTYTVLLVLVLIGLAMSWVRPSRPKASDSEA